MFSVWTTTGVTVVEFLREVLALPGQSERPTPAIAFTAFRDEVTRKQALDSGFQVYLTKPVDPTTVVREGRDPGASGLSVRRAPGIQSPLRRSTRPPP